MSDDLLAPFVIQCTECNQVLADSFSLLNFRNNTLIMGAVSSHCRISKTKHKGKDVIDTDCTFNMLSCSCGHSVGRRYITVNLALSDYVGRYCIERSSVKSYALGASSETEGLGLVEVCDEILKLQRFCVYLYNKMKKEEK
ncbi:Kinetochore protein mis18 [Astathelohania contejeani]|uniref:Protein yippee-like n=1 Tax=Astathelohania contejeani TaxID=164912 RepID=A0ABQ7HWR9_9MICR|nr:Kinetochore protein mis18 [Thelohania contejeani]